ncbi:MAG: class I SAM-dependent rRNA methyltransferase [Pyramidobacter sp.]|nr:class I SAM-dependent rRNA methyltransferase [Pyramidobacter sp.]
MKQERKYPRFTVTPKAERSVRNGHPWVYGEEVTDVSGEYASGDLVDVFARGERYLGTGFVNDHSKIRVRLISSNANDRFDDAFFERRLRYALDYRKSVMGNQYSCCRLIFGDSDLFPGLIVDRFDDVLVAQVLSLGMDMLKERLFPMLCRLLREDGQNISGVYERNDVAIRALEGLSQYCGEYPVDGLSLGGRQSARICENGVLYDVDFAEGQKTGFFLDQKFNRQAVARLSRGRRVLDCFTHTGSFALNAVCGGAQHVCAADISESAICMARHNAELNGFTDKMSFVTADVFDLLTDMAQRGRGEYDMIVLDPPAFAKSRRSLSGAERGYKEINLKAMKLLPRGGILATCSCSHFMTDELFRKMLFSAAQDAKVSLRQIEARQQAPDHPILWGVPETEYLKFYLFQVV